jgi:membrane protein YqaA with SNARE-associated domain
MHHFLDILKAWGPLGVFAIATIESAGIPNPGGTDFLLLFVAAARPADAPVSALLAIAGSLIGSLIFYEITRRGGEALLAKYTRSERGHRFRLWFLRYGLITVFIPAFLPIPILPFKVFAACAGALAVPRLRYMLVLAAARFPRYLALAFLGMQLRENAGGWITGHLWQLIVFAILLAATLTLLVKRANRQTVQ